MKNAVIFTATKNAEEFRTSRGFRNREIYELSTHDYQVKEYKVEELNIIPEQLAKVPDNSLGFLWLRCHGSPKKMTVCDNGDITNENIKALFKDLANKMTEDGIIYLESCSTGSLEDDFYNNMLFAFAKLTLNKPGVKIIAPSQKSYISQFCIKDAGEFSFNDIASPYDSENIAVILAKKTKTLLQEANTKDLKLAKINDSLRDSLVVNNKSHASFNIEKIPRNILLDARYNFTTILRKILQSYNSNKDVLEMVKLLIDGHYAEPNTPSDAGFYPFFWHAASPLAVAIYRKAPEIVDYLLSKGADANLVFRGRPLVKLAEIHAKQEQDFSCLTILKNHLSPKEEQVCTEGNDGNMSRGLASF